MSTSRRQFVKESAMVVAAGYAILQWDLVRAAIKIS
jgi:anaerobic selenocysteine-containing dehydrogenase